MLLRLLLLTHFNKITAFSISSTLINQTQRRLQGRHYLALEALRCQRESIRLSVKQFVSENLCSLLCVIVPLLVGAGRRREMKETNKLCTDFFSAQAAFTEAWLVKAAATVCVECLNQRLLGPNLART